MSRRNFVTLDLACDVRDGKKFCAGECVVTLGSTPLEAVAAFVDDDATGQHERWISTRDDVVSWLVARGLSHSEAVSLVDDIGDHDYEQRDVVLKA